MVKKILASLLAETEDVEKSQQNRRRGEDILSPSLCPSVPPSSIPHSPLSC
jgi:hypothetical protein